MRGLRYPACLLVSMACSLTAAAEDFAQVSWVELEAQAALPESATLEGEWLKVASTEGRTLELLVIETPAITSQQYVLKGQLRYRDVEGDGYLEMWNVFPEGRYFTRTLLEAGPLQKISGSSEGREFGLIFDMSGASAPPERLIVNLVLPGKGEVELSPLTLSSFDASAFRQYRSFGLGGLWGIVGAAFGVFAGTLGLLGGMGKARSFVLASFNILRWVGAAVLFTGGILYSRGAAYEAYYPMILIGFLSLIISTATLPGLRRRYEAQELRRIQALDAS